MKNIKWHEDTHEKIIGRKSKFDLMTADVIYDNGAEGKIYVTRATMNVMIFEQKHIGKIMTQKDFEDYKDLIREVSDVDRSYEEED